MASGKPGKHLRPGQKEELLLTTAGGGFVMETFGIDWVQLADPETGEAWVLYNVQQLDEDDLQITDLKDMDLAVRWVAPELH